jgi:hypothetical protein
LSVENVEDIFERAELKGPIIGGGASAIALFITVIGVGGVGDFEALRIIEAALPTTRFLASTAIGGGVTILALLLTLIGLSINTDITFHPRLYHRAKLITTLTVVAIVLGALLLLAVTMPLGEVEELRSFYDILYYILATAIAVLAGVLITVSLMISSALRGLIQLAHPEGSNQLLHEPDDEDDESV